jgi:hypothetical protein
LGGINVLENSKLDLKNGREGKGNPVKGELYF